ncbi:hypothetical protein [Alishewanella longhuensis]
MTWIEIKNEEEAKALMQKFGYFHDACIKEAHLWTEHRVNEDLSMSCSGALDTSIKFVVQRQFRNPSCIEMLFEQVTRINIVPSSENYDQIIYEALIGIEDGEFFWSVDSSETPKDRDPREDTWITSKILKWRVADEMLGSELSYGGT